MKRSTAVVAITVGLIVCSMLPGRAAETIKYSSQEGSLQQVIDKAPSHATVVCDSNETLELSAPVIIKKPMTLSGLSAKLPEKLGRTALIVVHATDVTLTHITLHGNYETVDQKARAPLMRIHMGDFRLTDCKFYDSSKDGVEVSPLRGGTDIVGGLIKDVEAFRMGRDAVSISGGNQGLRVRDLRVENVSLQKGYLRGAVEISDGTENIRVREVYAEDALYVIDVQDHRGKSAPNTNVEIEDVTAVNCKHIIRTDNSPRGHAGITLRNFTGKNCEAPVQISNTKDVTLEGIKIENHRSQKFPPISFSNCQGVNLKNGAIDTVHFASQSLRLVNCEDVNIEAF